MSRLTRQEQWFVAMVIGLLLVGWGVKTYRTMHPPATAPAQLTER
jgi:hypothetical protein